MALICPTFVFISYQFFPPPIFSCQGYYPTRKKQLINLVNRWRILCFRFVCVQCFLLLCGAQRNRTRRERMGNYVPPIDIRILKERRILFSGFIISGRVCAFFNFARRRRDSEQRTKSALFYRETFQLLRDTTSPRGRLGCVSLESIPHYFTASVSCMKEFMK